jgi:NAD(P)-dependent dehydrogenase (short-subunit alcohol dehydrogenase family)
MHDRVMMVTGGGSGIGQATALIAGRAGARVYVLGRRLEPLAETCGLVKSAGGRCTPLQADVGRYQDIAAAVERICAESGRLDVLINSAGVAPLAPMAEFDIAAFDTLVDVNISGVFYAARAVWPLMVRQRRGCIVNVSSIAAVDPFPGFQAYGASKAWVNALTSALAEEGREHGIRIYAVAPGAVETPLLRQVFPDYPAERCLSAEDVARAIGWLLDEGAIHASGTVIYVRKS